MVEPIPMFTGVFVNEVHGHKNADEEAFVVTKPKARWKPAVNVGRLEMAGGMC